MAEASDLAGHHPRSPWRWMFIGALLVYLLAATFQLHLPGINYDEVLDAVPAMQAVLNQPLDSAGTLHLFGRDWPLMTMPYIGGTTSYLLLPGFAALGINVVVLRLTTIFVGLVSLALVWGFLRELFDERVAALSVLLLALNPTYVFWSRMGAWVAQPLLPITIAALWSLLRWYRTGKQKSLVSAVFWMGFGLTTKLLFLWMWVALGLAWLLLSPFLQPVGEPPVGGWRRWLWPLQKVTPRGVAFCALALLTGLAPLIIYNVQGGATFSFFEDAVMSQETTRIASLTTLRDTPRVALADLTTLLNGSWFKSRFGTTAVNSLAVPALGIAVATIAGLGLRRRLSHGLKRPALLVILLVSIPTMGAAASISQGAEHLIILWPIPQALIAVAAFGLADLVGRGVKWQRTVGWTMIAAVITVVLAAEGLTTLRHHRALAQTGGIGHFSDAINALDADLEASPHSRLIVLDWGFKRNLQFLSAGRLKPEEWFAYGPPAGETESYLEQLVSRPDLLYLFHTPRFTAFPGHWDLFDKVIYRHGLTPVMWKAYNQRDGAPVYQVYTLAPASPLTELPAAARPDDVLVGDDIRLLGYDLPAAAQPGTTWQATLYWQALSAPARNFKVFAHVVDDTGKLWSQYDAVPRAWGHPTTAWQPGEIIADRIWLPAPAGAPLGAYHLFVGMVDEITGQRLPVQRAGRQIEGDTLELGEVSLQP